MKYIVTPNEGESYEVEADEMIVSEHNPNQVTLVKSSGKTVAQENNARSVRPKNA